MKQTSVRLDDETFRQIAELAELWGLPEVRHLSQVVTRCVERVHTQEFSAEDDSSNGRKNTRSIDNE